MKSYNGHRSWNAWNVAMWINSDEFMYNWAKELVREHGRGKAARIMAREMDGQKTPDGGKYNKTAIYEALADINN